MTSERIYRRGVLLFVDRRRQIFGNHPSSGKSASYVEYCYLLFTTVSAFCGSAALSLQYTSSSAGTNPQGVQRVVRLNEPAKSRAVVARLRNGNNAGTLAGLY
ncbi:uncharacterized protein SCHCODRAFT_01293323 [Schizophyllum commune H4-8]|uniref:uncharacterized protein n=1 Tax=Schizophyllum commune (strain H4-8 / FGSC 9210) TaxID=578458 RepID=UPI00216078EA|nr:uncharacterized protein SCHCODRAFT_01293323 [Schizophyllum commune H4-8]KAI5896679.1 hypothetical protein SCHCODRAFT_01293323 [Schizophyllum commune H4-8]